MGTNSGCNGDSRAVDCETTPTPGGMGLRPIVLELRMPFSPEAGGSGVPGMLDPRMVDGHAYVEALAREVLASAPDYADCQVQAVALTGGMAAHVADDMLAQLLRDMRHAFLLAEDAEVSLRIRPGMASAASMDAFRIGHVNRLVVDYATHSANEWRTLGRTLGPNAMDVTRMVLGPRCDDGLGVKLADRRIDLSFELLAGIPGQTPSGARESVKAALSYGAAEVHLMTCGDSPSEKAVSCRLAMSESLQAAGFAEYAPHRWALTGHESRFVQLGGSGQADILGYGLAARTRFEGIEARNTSDLATYLHFSDDPEMCIAEVHHA